VLFSDPRYLLFLATVAGLFFLLPAGTARRALLALASYGFYMAFSPVYGLLLLGITAVAYAGGLALGRPTSDRRRNALLALCLGFAFLPLLIFKYFDFLSRALWRAAAVAGLGYDPPLLKILLPLGISFYTFQAAGYLIDVYVGTANPERSPLRFLVFLSFFPQLVSGPIERARSLMPQLDCSVPFDYDAAVRGLREVLWGLFLKIVLADTLGPIVEPVYAAPRTFAGSDHLLAVLYYAFQVYADFAGYSLIAIGSARLLGVQLSTNFRQPFLSQTVPDFWRSWHISLSFWMRDYVFTPLQFRWRRLGAVGISLALFVTFVVVGLWHGAGLKYVCFGVVHGIYMSFSNLTSKARARIWAKTSIPLPVRAAARVLTTFSLVTLSFVFFRADSVRDALWIYRAILTGPFAGRTLGVATPGLIISILLLADVSARRGLSVGSLPTPVRWLGYHAAAACLVLTVLRKVLAGAVYARQFIYFQF
jgi:hypothetical protein